MQMIMNQSEKGSNKEKLVYERGSVIITCSISYIVMLNVSVYAYVSVCLYECMLVCMCVCGCNMCAWMLAYGIAELGVIVLMLNMCLC